MADDGRCSRELPTTIWSNWATGSSHKADWKSHCRSRVQSAARSFIPSLPAARRLLVIGNIRDFQVDRRVKITRAPQALIHWYRPVVGKRRRHLSQSFVMQIGERVPHAIRGFHAQKYMQQRRLVPKEHDLVENTRRVLVGEVRCRGRRSSNTAGARRQTSVAAISPGSRNRNVLAKCRSQIFDRRETPSRAVPSQTTSNYSPSSPRESQLRIA